MVHANSFTVGFAFVAISFAIAAGNARTIGSTAIVFILVIQSLIEAACTFFAGNERNGQAEENKKK